jgi:hypothetical protein
VGDGDGTGRGWGFGLIGRAGTGTRGLEGLGERGKAGDGGRAGTGGLAGTFGGLGDGILGGWGRGRFGPLWGVFGTGVGGLLGFGTEGGRVGGRDGLSGVLGRFGCDGLGALSGFGAGWGAGFGFLDGKSLVGRGFPGRGRVGATLAGANPLVRTKGLPTNSLTPSSTGDIFTNLKPFLPKPAVDRGRPNRGGTTRATDTNPRIFEAERAFLPTRANGGIGRNARISSGTTFWKNSERV